MDDSLTPIISAMTPAGYEEKGRILRLTTPLGENALIATKLTGTETLGEGFSFHLKVFSESHHSLTAKDLVGLKATIRLVKSDNTIRYFNGYINSLKQTGHARAGGKTIYDLHITSRLQLMLSRRTDCRIFQEMTIPQVIEKILQSLGQDWYRINTKNEHKPRRFLVQYNESDLAFFHRLCYMAGLTFYFEHQQNEHRIFLVDNAELLPQLETDTLYLQQSTGNHEHLNRWQGSEKLGTGNFEQNAYNYKNPNAPVRVKTIAPSDTLKPSMAQSLTSYADTEAFHTMQEGNEHIRTRAAQAVAGTRVFSGSGDYRTLHVGHHFRVSGPPGGGLSSLIKAKNVALADHDRFTLIDVQYHIDGETSGFHCDIKAVPYGELMYPKASFPKIASLQTAVVTGPAGEDIYTDDFGRIKVQFHWDREGEHDQHSSCWLRVMQNFAGPAFGSHFTPRIGHEVVIAFENGNPDRPFVLGALYHPENTPPYAEHNGTRAGIRTRTTKTDAASKYNELYFEDKSGAEEVYLQAERDHNRLIKNDFNTKVGHNKTDSIANDFTMEIGNNKTQKIAKNESHSVGNNASHQIGKKWVVEAGDKIELKVGGSTISISSGKIEISGAVVNVKGNIALN